MGKQSTSAPVWSAGVMGTARWKGDAGDGETRFGEGSGLDVAKGGGRNGSQTGS